MTKEQAFQILKTLISQLKLTKQEYDTLEMAIRVLSESEKPDGK